MIFQDFQIYKKREGQMFQNQSVIGATSFEEAKKEFAKKCYSDLLNGKCGDNFTEKEEGVFFENELIFSKDNLEEGITSFWHDVYVWELRDTFKFVGIDEDGDVMHEVFATSLKEAEQMMEGYDLKVLKEKTLPK